MILSEDDRQRQNLFHHFQARIGPLSHKDARGGCPLTPCSTICPRVLTHVPYIRATLPDNRSQAARSIFISAMSITAAAGGTPGIAPWKTERRATTETDGPSLHGLGGLFPEYSVADGRPCCSKDCVA